MSYSLRRLRDGAGDCGSWSCCYLKTDSGHWEESGPKPKLGGIMRVGSISARSYSYQDYWQTTVITKIFYEEEGFVSFKTGNSHYIWRSQ